MPPKSKDVLAVRPPTGGPSPTPDSKSSKATKRDYSSDGVQDHDIFKLPVSDYKWIAFLLLVASAVRLFRIYQPTSVVFDEVHFGGFARKYIKGTFFMDVHPPLAKLLITLAGYLAGFDGNFTFKEIGMDYIEPRVPYVAMRMVPAVLGVLTVPLMFLTLRAWGCQTATAAFGALLVTFENALTTQSRFILLDSPLLFFTALTALSFTCFTNQHEQGPSKAFKPLWWFWLALTGLSLGATLSVKWVGLFTVAWVGSLTVLQLWVLLGDPETVTPRRWFKHFFARAFCLIVIPLTFYLVMFGIHFTCLRNSGDGDGFMSPEFQSTLKKKGMKDVPADVVLGSRVTIRHHNTQGGYLHSHPHMYPGGSKQQQITLYPHKDENNLWVVENKTQPLGPDGTEIKGPYAWDNMTVNYIKDGDVIRLNHVMTQRRLHSHDIRPPVTDVDWQNEVSAYGFEGFDGDANDLFRVQIIKHMSDGEVAKERLRTIQTKFKLVHVMTGCVLFSHKVKLPDWGWEQQEVTCARGATLPNSVWYVETNSHPALPADAEKVNYRRPGFLGKFWELQRVMWRTNAGLTDSHNWESRPPSWPALLRGINFWGKDHRQVYLLGNPLIWWSSSLAVAIYVVFKGVAVLRWQRSCNDYRNVTFKRFDYELGTTVLAWAFHYFPFYLMARQLFLHHYLPALYFSIMLLCQMLDFVFYRIKALKLASRPGIGKAAMAIFLGLSVAIFVMYSPLVYGNPWTRDACKQVKLLKSWDFDCNTFYTNLSQYKTQYVRTDVAAKSSATAQSTAPKAQVGGDAAVKQPQQAEAGKGQGAAVSEDPLHDVELLRREKRVEFRDEAGNVLDPELVASLHKEGKISLETRYETRDRYLDEKGNEVHQVKREHREPPKDFEKKR